MRHLPALGHLARSTGMSYSELARRASVTPQSMQATLTKLEERGAVAKTTDSGRGRTAHLSSPTKACGCSGLVRTRSPQPITCSPTTLMPMP
ncbi:MAG: MarR family transcriptional regulator [Mycobacterium sp.]